MPSMSDQPCDGPARTEFREQDCAPESQNAFERTYQKWASVYDWLTPLYLFGNETRLRRETISALHLEPGQAVLDLGCGTGRNSPFILERIGPTDKLVGVDYTPAMLEKARERETRAGWKNVELIQADAAHLDLRRKFDSALCTLAIAVIPDTRGALDHMVAHVKSGGRVVIGDGKRSARGFGPLLNWVPDLWGYGAAQNMSRRPWECLRALVDDFDYKEWAWGFFYVAMGNVRTPQS